MDNLHFGNVLLTYSFWRQKHTYSDLKSSINVTSNGAMQLTDTIGQTPLHIASLCNNIDAIRLFTELGAEINVQDDNGDTPLHASVTKGNIEALNKLIELGADINIKNKKGFTILDFSIIYHRKDIENILYSNNSLLNLDNAILNLGYKVNKYSLVEDDFWLTNPQISNITEDVDVFSYSTDRISSLQFAIKYNRNDMASFLISKYEEKGIELTKQDIIYALSYNNMEIFNEIISKNRKLINNESDILFEVMYRQDGFISESDIIDTIVKENKELVNSVQKNGVTTLLYCLWQHKYDLIDKFANDFTLDEQEKEEGNTPLHYYLKNIMNNEVDIDILKKLTTDENLKLKNNNGNTPLHLAIQHAYRRVDVIEFLIDMGSDISEKDALGNNALHLYLTKTSDFTIISLLLRKGISVIDKNNNGNTALHVAISYRHSLKTIEEIIKSNPQTATMKNNNGEEPIMLVAFNGVFGVIAEKSVFASASTEDTISLLIKYGSNINVANKNEDTLFHKHADNWMALQQIYELGCQNVNSNKQGNTPLHLACQHRDLGYNHIEFFLEKFPTMNKFDDRNSNGDCPLDIFLKAHYGEYTEEVFKVISLLISNTGFFRIQNNQNETFLHHIAKKRYNNSGDYYEKVLELLINTIPKVMNMQNNDGETPLHIFLKNRDEKSVMFLLNTVGIDVNIENKEGKTPRDIAEDFGLPQEVKEKLADLGARYSKLRSHIIGILSIFRDEERKLQDKAHSLFWSWVGVLFLLVITYMGVFFYELSDRGIHIDMLYFEYYKLLSIMQRSLLIAFSILLVTAMIMLYRTYNKTQLLANFFTHKRTALELQLAMRDDLYSKENKDDHDKAELSKWNDSIRTISTDNPLILSGNKVDDSKIKSPLNNEVIKALTEFANAIKKQ